MAVWQPADTTQLTDAIGTALAERSPVEIIGGGTKRGLGRPVQAAQLVDVSRLAGIRLYEPEELVLTAGAGTPLDEIEAALAARRQHLAFEPPDYRRLLGSADGSQTLGGVVAANLAGPRRFAAGAARDHLLGFSAVSGRGEVFKSGGRVVKNVTGYDVSKLMAGSWGTLAVLAELSLKVLPRPADCATLVLPGLDADAAVTVMARALGSPHEVTGAAWLPDQGVLLRLEGPAPSVAFRSAALTALLAPADRAMLDQAASETIWRDLRDVGPFVADRVSAIWRVSVAPMAGAAMVKALPEARAFLDWGGGLVWLAMPPAPDAGAARVRAAVAATGGHATLIRADAATRAAIDVFEPLPPALAALTRRVKASFDPACMLNPGRMFAGV